MVAKHSRIVMGCAVAAAVGMLLSISWGRIVRFGGDNEYQVRELLQAEHPGIDDWTWRDSLEEQLSAMGLACAPAMESIIDNYQFHQRDAIEVAVFRIRQAMVAPKPALEQWATRQFNLDDRPETLAVVQIRHVVSGPNAAPLRKMFPNHLFYGVMRQANRESHLVAFASDGKVQALDDDTSLTRFIRGEMAEATYMEDRQDITKCAAVLIAARSGLLLPSNAVVQELGDHLFEAQVIPAPAAGARVKVAFDKEAMVERIEGRGN